MGKTQVNRGRIAAVDAITKAVRDFPDIFDVRPKVGGLTDADARLAHAIVDTVVRRWLTLERLIDQQLHKNLRRKLRSRPKATLLCGAAQMIYLDRLPNYAVVDESVAVFYKHKPTAGMINAVLRQIASLDAEQIPDGVWQPDPHCIPLEAGYVKLNQPVLPPVKQFTHYLSIVTSHPRELIDRWREQFGDERTMYLCLHSLKQTPTILSGPGLSDLPAELAIPHDLDGHAVWIGEREALIEWLAGHPLRRVQDVTPSEAVASLNAISDTPPQVVLDFCAGKGTKTRVLAERFSEAMIYGHEPDDTRFGELIAATESIENIRVILPEQLPNLLGKVDLLLLDVPCSNTGVLARRAEARYRLNAQSLADLIDLQQKIIQRSLPLLAPGGHLLYTTCSIESEENQLQSDWIMQKHRLRLVSSGSHLPSGEGPSYRDGGYWALFQK